MVFEWMIPVYGWMIKMGKRTIETIPERYRLPVAEWLVAQAEVEANAKKEEEM